MWSSADHDLAPIVAFTGDAQAYGAAMMRVVFEWPNTMLNALSGGIGNKRAFVGHCACCLVYGWPEHAVRAAWKQLSQQQQDAANNEADKAILAWKKKFEDT